MNEIERKYYELGRLIGNLQTHSLCAKLTSIVEYNYKLEDKWQGSKIVIELGHPDDKKHNISIGECTNFPKQIVKEI